MLAANQFWKSMNPWNPINVSHLTTPMNKATNVKPKIVKQEISFAFNGVVLGTVPNVAFNLAYSL
jgi:hypothetical protein